ncbi:hypothetical protein [Aliiglaciecola lipolytica]|uniref:Uncharacterized protein n=1 Tax=Aliiglaciecola lipolytica E3 TaxID=1127673 RepID=K6XVP3_9ALTE|nr:hypothetical protein [Aliiglaciecola lipolytica]GAC15731.1 hypothetical protein GLIP_3110 [Aliiglaciecola lipolytica E3]
MDKLIAALIVVLLLLIALALWFYNKWKTSNAIKAAKGTIPNGTTPGQATIIDAWTTAPTTVAAGVNTTFVLTVTSNQVTVVPVTGREYIIAAPAGVTIVSINGAAPNNPAIGTTTATGTITVVIKADPVEQPTAGALVAQQTSAASTTAVSAGFTIQ